MSKSKPLASTDLKAIEGIPTNTAKLSIDSAVDTKEKRHYIHPLRQCTLL
ncbi:MAG: hypothetical protein M3258_09900 [Thermoproteota archaeon]|nr:hypothetical protein [Thermoproteota archaeon]